MANSVMIKDTTVHVGDTIKISYSFKEADKEKEQIFQGVLMGLRGRENGKMITIRKLSKDHIGIERIFPVISPFIKKVSVIKKGHTKRAKIRFIRALSDQELREKLS